jgi:phosphate starvation-inducible PhoH-like protein
MDTAVKKPKTEVKFSLTLTEEQKRAKEQVLQHAVTFLEGQAGCGKTLLACQIALDLVFKKQAERIIITRPTVGTEDTGFLPGTFQEKMEPWMVPIRDNLRKVYNKPEKLEQMEHAGQIELVSLAHFRGRTFDNAVCIIDEYQNLTKQQLVMALGRLGKNSIMIFCGDGRQIDLRSNNDSAVHDVPKIVPSRFVSRIVLLDNHRHEAVNDILKLLLG